MSLSGDLAVRSATGVAAPSVALRGKGVSGARPGPSPDRKFRFVSKDGE